MDDTASPEHAAPGFSPPPALTRPNPFIRSFMFYRRIKARTRGVAAPAIIGIIVVLLAAVTVTVMVFGAPGDKQAAGDRDVFTVQRGNFDITIPASGELVAVRQTEIASQLETRAVITELVDEGVKVQKGDVLLRLNDDEIVERIKDAEDEVNTSEASYIAAKADLDIKRHAAQSELAKADLEVKLAELALKAWEEGEAVSTRRTLELDVETSQKDYDRLVARFEASKKLRERNFISEDEYQRDEIEMIRAYSRLEQAKIAMQVYRDYQYEQERAQNESDVQQAKDRRSETEQRNANEIQSLETEVQSRAYQLNSRRERLQKLQRQLEACTIIAPQDGLVVYATSLESGRRGDDEALQVGTEVPRNRTLLILPDTSRMAAEVKVNEALTGKIDRGQRALVYADAVPDRPIRGEVMGVSVLAETGGWRDPNRREYSVRIALNDGEGLGLKPSMGCRAEIYVERAREVLFIPIQGVFRRGSTAYVYLRDGSSYRQRVISVGRASELFIEVLEGLQEGNQILLREPRSDLVIEVLPREEREESETSEDDESNWGGGGGPPEAQPDREQFQLPPGETGGRPAGPEGRERREGERRRGGEGGGRGQLPAGGAGEGGQPDGGSGGAGAGSGTPGSEAGAGGDGSDGESAANGSENGTISFRQSPGHLNLEFVETAI